MGSPKKHRKKYSTPSHPWQKSRIEEEKVLLKEYGLKNKKEIWKATSMLRQFKRQAKDLIANRGEQAEKQKELFLNKLNRLSIIQKTDMLDAVLGLDVRDILNRRLQTVVLNKGLARSVKQSRQFITHEHIIVGDKKITKPSYMVEMVEENQLNFEDTSSLANEEHPERSIKKKSEEVEKEVKKKDAIKKEKEVEESKEEQKIEEVKEEESSTKKELEKEPDVKEKSKDVKEKESPAKKEIKEEKSKEVKE